MKNKKPQSIHEKYKAISAMGTEVYTPYHVWRILGDSNHKFIEVVGNQICMGEDFASMAEARAAVAWYVDQLGGSVLWKNEA
jgi:hypothetical protein